MESTLGVHKLKFGSAWFLVYRFHDSPLQPFQYFYHGYTQYRMTWVPEIEVKGVGILFCEFNDEHIKKSVMLIIFASMCGIVMGLPVDCVVQV
eukprot:gene12938-biopygen3512